MKLRKLKRSEVTFSLHVDFELEDPAGQFSTGDTAEDKAIVQDIRNRIVANDVWAWCSVTVVAHWKDWTGADTLGCCSYDDETDFRSGDYYESMCDQALDNLNAAIQRDARALEELEVKGR